MRTLITLPFLLAAVSLNCQAGDIYKWQENGKTVYGEYPPAGVQAQQLSKTSAVKVDYHRPSAQELAGKADEASSKKAEAKQIVADAAAYKEARDKNCSSAQRNLAVLQTGGRHRFKLPDGTVTYLDEAETKRRVNEAREAIHDYCD